MVAAAVAVEAALRPVADRDCRWPDATNDEVIDSIVPVATGLAAVASVTPPEVRLVATGRPVRH